ncbi:MAG: hypothetical protein GXP25_13950 [Planctomycetes bacterium]|nr:hypothetical protein [Planctomycetota bacterium]
MTAKSMRSKRFAPRIVFACLLIALSAGCINYEEEITLNSDKSGTITMHYWTSEKFAAIAEQKEKETKGEQTGLGLPFSQDQAERIFNIEKVIKIKYGPTIDKGRERGYRHITITCEFDDINDEKFPSIPLFEGGSISFKEDEKGNLVFTRVFRSPEALQEQLEKAAKEAAEKGEAAPKSTKEKPEISLDEDSSDPGDTLAKSVFSEYKLKFVVNFPGRILKTNGSYYEEGEEPGYFEWLRVWFWGHRKAVWEFRLADIAKKGNLTATIKNKLPWEWFIITAVVILALVLIIAQSKRRAGEEGTEHEETPSDERKGEDLKEKGEQE